MNAETLEALRGSIAKWQRIAAGTGVNRGPIDCPLCLPHCPSFQDTPVECEGCPVKQATGKPNCLGSPYWKFLKADVPGASAEHLQHLAAAERDFLISLLPADVSP
jgi:hypothetical protein